MNCPVCGRALEPMTVGDLTVDVCRGGCGGIWFDRLELAKVDNEEEAAGEALLDIERSPAVPVDLEARRRCPKCRDIVMMRHFYGPTRQVEVDECAQCGGVWLDAGELAAARRQYKTEAERRQAAHEFALNVFGTQLGGPPPGRLGDLPPHLITVDRLLRFVLHRP